MVEKGRGVFDYPNNIIDFQAYKDRREIVPMETVADLDERMFFEHVQHPDMQEYFDELVSCFLVQDNPEQGIYGVILADEEDKERSISIQEVLSTYHDLDLRDEVNRQNLTPGQIRTYRDATAERLDVSDSHIDASICYFIQHEVAFTAHHIVKTNLGITDPRLQFGVNNEEPF